MPTLMPTDANNNPIPALRLKQDGAHQIAASSSSTRNAIAFDAMTEIISIYATVPIYIRFGNAAVVAQATDHYFPAGIYYDLAIAADDQGRATHIAIMRAGDTDGSVYISEKM